jgi:hypothetical protein
LNAGELEVLEDYEIFTGAGLELERTTPPPPEPPPA